MHFQSVYLLLLHDDSTKIVVFVYLRLVTMARGDNCENMLICSFIFREKNIGIWQLHKLWNMRGFNFHLFEFDLWNLHHIMYIYHSAAVPDLCIHWNLETYKNGKIIYNYPVLRHFASISLHTIRYRWSFTFGQPESLFAAFRLHTKYR